jgi:hypothetical protein
MRKHGHRGFLRPCFRMGGLNYSSSSPSAQWYRST